MRLLRLRDGISLQDKEEIAGSTYTKIVALNDVLTPTQVRCSRCGNQGRANPRIVGKARKVNGCVECL